MLRSFTDAIGMRLRPREGLLETWWERVLAGVAVVLLTMFVIDIMLRGW